MRYAIAPIACRPWLLNGLSDRLIVSHYENNYGGAVRRLNAIVEKLESLDFDAAPGFVVKGLKQEELVAMNSMILHELYFASLGGDGKPAESMREALAQSFGSAARWKSEFTAMGRALGGGSGWVLLAYLPRERKLANSIGTDHTWSAAGAIPLLALDMYEHAYHMDFGANAGAYVDAFMRNIDWKGVEARYLAATGIGYPEHVVDPAGKGLPSVPVEAVRELSAGAQKPQLIDARPRHYYTKSADMMAGATWRDPERVEEWIGEVRQSEPVYVYCAYGFHVGCGVTAALREKGFDARYVEGGFSAWKAIGGARQAGPAG
jgi:Fe-Mn family superoxide dismutase